MILAYLTIFLTNLILILLAWRLVERKRLNDMLLIFSSKHAKYLSWGLGAGLGEALLVYSLLAALGGVRSSWGLAPVAGYTLFMFLGWALASSIVVPFLEEILNRGYWFQNIRRGWGSFLRSLPPPCSSAGCTC